MIYFFNIGSLLLGLAAWILGALAIIGKNPENTGRLTLLSSESCALALLFQIFEIGNRAYIGDFAAIEDTIRAVAIASIVLITVTAVLNSVAINKKR